MSELHIFDMMAFVHAGHVNKYSYLSQTMHVGAGWQTLYIPTGGASLLFNKLYEVTGKGDVVVVTDRNPTIKKDMIPGYKSNRSYSHEISVDKAATEYILQQCGIQLFAREGYEADDIAYSLVKDLHDKYDHIYLYTGDSDWYFMVDNTVSIMPSSSTSKTVTLETFEDMTGYYYNTITLTKICEGDSSDCIPGLGKEVSDMILEKLNTPAIRRLLGNKDMVLNMFHQFFPAYEYQVHNVFPLYVKDLNHECSVPDKRMICNFGCAIKNKRFSGRMSPSFDITQHTARLCENGVYILKEGDEV